MIRRFKLFALFALLVITYSFPANAQSTPFECDNYDDTEYYDVAPNICDLVLWNEDEEAPSEFYALEHSISLIGNPDREFVVFYKLNGEWHLDGFAFDRNLAVKKAGKFTKNMRYVSMPASQYVGQKLQNVFQPANITQMSNVDFYGNPRPKKDGSNASRTDEFIVCTDGSSLTIYGFKEGKFFQVQRHGCAGRTLIDDTASEFLLLVKKHDKKLAKLLKDLIIQE